MHPLTIFSVFSTKKAVKGCALYQSCRDFPHKNANLDKRKAFFFYARKARFYAVFGTSYPDFEKA